jgi:hypothetical protein
MKQNITNPHMKNEFRKVMIPRRPTMSRYEYLFLGKCFPCNNFGHKAINCKVHPRNDQRINGGMYNAPRNNYVNNKVKNHVDNRNKNSFSPLFNYYIKCYKCHYFGHKSQDCISWTRAPIEKHIDVNNNTKVWKKKQERSHHEECDLAMHAHDKESYWYIDSGCSRHMTSDENKFLKLKREKGGNVSCGDNKSTKIIGKGKVILGSQKI